MIFTTCGHKVEKLYDAIPIPVIVKQAKQLKQYMILCKKCALNMSER